MGHAMNRDTLGKLWTVVGLANLYLTFNIASAMHGSEFYLPFIRIDAVNYYAAAVYGIFVTAPVGIAAFFLTREFARHANSQRWAERIPIAFALDIHPDTKPGKAYQVFFFLFFLVVPSAANLDFTNKFFHGTIYDKESSVPVSVGLSHLWPERKMLSVYGKAGYRFGEPNTNSAKPGVDIYPIIIPWTIVAIEAFYFAALGVAIFSVFPIRILNRAA